MKSEKVIAFVNHLHQEIKQPLLIIWDGLRAHWSKAVKAHIATFEGAILVKQLPAYAPELNPVEYLWSHLKRTDLANLAAKNLEELSKVSHAGVAKILPNPTQSYPNAKSTSMPSGFKPNSTSQDYEPI